MECIFLILYIFIIRCNELFRSDSMSTSDSKVFQFDMKSLKELLRKQSEQNPNASYFNLDLLKYQVSVGSNFWRFIALGQANLTHQSS